MSFFSPFFLTSCSSQLWPLGGFRNPIFIFEVELHVKFDTFGELSVVCCWFGAFGSFRFLFLQMYIGFLFTV